MVDDFAIGMTLTPVHARVEPGRLRFFLDVLDERNSVYRDLAAARAAGFSERPIPPTYLVCLEMMDGEKPFEILEALKVNISRILHGEQKFIYRAPVYVGDELTFETSVTGVQHKKGGALTMIDVTTKIANQHGKPVADCVRVIVVRN
jgi:acyl dehydratase